MKPRWIHIIILLFLALQVNAQITTPPKGKKQKADPNWEQRQIDEQLAGQYFREQDYEKAHEIYKKLYNSTKQPYHFQQYIECCLLLNRYKEAERELKSFYNDNPTYSRSLVDLIYVYTLEGKNGQAQKQFDEILKTMPENASVVRNLGSQFQSRRLYDMATAVYEKGNKMFEGKETFYMDMAYMHQSSANYQQAFQYYFMELEVHPGQYNNIRNRLQSMLFYDVNKSITDELRTALLKRTQEKPDSLELAQLLVWLATQEEDYDIALAQCLSIDRKTNNQDGQIMNLAGICLNNKQFEVAKEGYSYVQKKGKSNPYYGQALAGAINTDYRQLQAAHSSDKKAYNSLLKRIEEAYNDINSNDLTKLMLIEADIMTYQLGQTEDAVALLVNTLPNVGGKQDQAQLKLKLADIYLHEDEIWEATLLYSQVDKSMKEEPLGHEARFKNAQLRYFIGEYEWAESQLKVLKAATSKLIANDAMTLSLIIKDNLEADTSGLELKRLARADYRIYQQRDDEALALLDDIIANGNEVSIPHALFRKGEITEKRKEYEAAEQLFLQIVEQYPDSYMADAALMQAALTEQNQLKNKELAKQHY